MTCPQCGTEIPRQSLGRPRKFCSDGCREAHRKAARVAKKLVEDARSSLRRTEQRVFSVLEDDAKRAQLFIVLQQHRALIRRTIRNFEASRDLPVEMIGTSALVVQRPDGSVAYRFESVLQGIAQQSVAELVFIHDPSRITEAMIVNRIRARLEDERRASPDFVRRQASAADGSTSRWTERKTPALVSSSYVSPDVTGERATAAIDRRTRVARLEGLEQLAFFVYISARQPGDTLVRLFAHPGLRPAVDCDPEVFRKLSADGPRGGDPLAAVRWFYRDIPGVSWADVKEALATALAKVGEPALPEILGDGPEPSEDDV